MGERFSLDALDKGIIKILSIDGRTSFKEIAQRLEVTEKTIRTRFNNLKDNGILEVVGIINPLSLGLKVGTIVQIRVKPNLLESIVNELNEIQGVRFVTMTSGEYQLLVQANLKDYEELTDVIKRINTIQGISRTNVMLQMDIFKNTFEYI